MAKDVELAAKIGPGEIAFLAIPESWTPQEIREWIAYFNERHPEVADRVFFVPEVTTVVPVEVSRTDKRTFYFEPASVLGEVDRLAGDGWTIEMVGGRGVGAWGDGCGDPESAVGVDEVARTHGRTNGPPR